MALQPGTNRQVPDHSIMDAFNKQTYLGNQFVYSSSQTSGGSSETTLYLLRNPAVTSSGFPANYTSLFVNFIKSVCITASQGVTLRAYLTPTVTAGTQTVALAPDVSGSLNSTFFLLNGPGNTNKYYVWYNINSAGVDPAVAGRTGIAVAGATNVTAANLGTATKNAINSAAAVDFTVTGTSTITITNTSVASFTAAVDGSAATGFTFAVTSAGNGTAVTPVNLRPASPTTSIAGLSTVPTVSANGTLLFALAAIPGSADAIAPLVILDPGKSLLVTIQATATSTVGVPNLGWFEQ